MDDDIEERIRGSFEQIQKGLDELKWQQYLPLLPHKLLSAGDPRNRILLPLGWLLSDLPDIYWGGFTAKEVVQVLRDIADAISDCTE
jgi:hypothetical protein